MVTNSRLLYRGELHDLGLSVKDGRILRIGKEPELMPAEITVNAKGMVVLPGAIDVHVHLRDEGLSYKETFETGTAAAIAGGITTVLDMPNNSPPTNTLARLTRRIQIARSRILCNVGFYAAPNSKRVETTNVLGKGAVGLKVNMLKPIGEILSDAQIESDLLVAREVGAPAAFHAEDRQMVEDTQNFLVASGRTGFGDFLSAHKPSCEESAVKKALSLIQRSRSQGHIAHISCRASLLRKRLAKTHGVKVTCEVTPHHLLLNAGKMKNLKGLGVMTPPLRKEEDQYALWHGLSEGSIEICASDHAPHTYSEKSSNDVWEVSPGVSGLDIFMQLMLTQVEKGRISLSRLVEAVSIMPAKIFGIKERGVLERGCHADFIIVDPKRSGCVLGENFKSRAKFTPFEGEKLSAEVVSTYVGGVLVCQEGEIVCMPGIGEIVRGAGQHAGVPTRRDAR